MNKDEMVDVLRRILNQDSDSSDMNSKLVTAIVAVLSEDGDDKAKLFTDAVEINEKLNIILSEDIDFNHWLYAVREAMLPESSNFFKGMSDKELSNYFTSAIRFILASGVRDGYIKVKGINM